MYLKKINVINRIASQILATRLVYASNSFLGMFLIAKLGQEQLAAGAIVSTIYMTIFLICLGILFSVGIIIGRLYGAKQYAEIGSFVRNSYILAFLLAIPVIIFLNLTAPILVFFKQDPNIVMLASSYLKYISIGILPALLITVLDQFSIGISQQRFVTISTIICLPVNVILGYALIFGHFGLPSLGMTGYAIATAIVNWTFLIILVGYFALHHKYKTYSIFNFSSTWDKQKILLLLKIGVPISIQHGGELAAFAVSTLFIGWFGAQALAGQQIVLQWTIIIGMIPFSISQASSILVSQSIGQEDHANLKKLSIVSILYSLSYMLLASFLFIFAPKLLASFYINVNQSENMQALAIARQLFMVTAIFLVFDAIRNVITGILRAFHDTQGPMKIGISAFWIIGLPLGYLLGFTFNWGPAGIRWGFVIGIILAVVLLAIRLHEKINQTEKTELNLATD